MGKLKLTFKDNFLKFGEKSIGFTPPVTTASEFIILVDTTNTGWSVNDTMRLPIRGTDMTIDWGDGTVETGIDQTATPTSGNWITRVYPDGGGVKQIKITGLDWIYFTGTGDRLKLLEIQNWGTGQWATMNNAFNGCGNMTGTFTDAPDLSLVTNMINMFGFATNFNSDISGWDVSEVTNMAGMFHGATTFNSDISQWNVGNVTDMSSMFRVANGFNSNISLWNTAKVTTMFAMFYQATAFNSDISQWNTGEVTNMGSMFSGASDFNQDLSGWCVSQFGSLPSNFDANTTAWVGGTSTRPQWGQPCT